MDNGESKEICTKIVNRYKSFSLQTCTHSYWQSYAKLSSTRSVPFTNIQAYRRLIRRLTCISLISDLTWHFLWNNFFNFLLSLQLLTILQQLEFSDILKEFQVLIYFSLPTVLLIWKPFVIVVWGTCSDSRQWVTDFSVYFWNALISQKSKK